MRFFRALFAAAMMAIVPVAAAAQAGAPTPTCAAGDPVVWVNTSSNVYHMQGSHYYGNTKAGKYECKSAADKSGARQAKTQSGATKSPGAMKSPSAMHSMAPAMPAAGPTKLLTPVPGGSAMPSPMASAKQKRHRGASPSPGAMSSASPSAAASPSGKKSRHHKASPSPSASDAAASPKPSKSPKAHRSKKASPAPSPT